MNAGMTFLRRFCEERLGSWSWDEQRLGGRLWVRFTDRGGGVERYMQRRRPRDMPGGLLVTLVWVFVSSGGLPWSE
jgi:hypothetical protein